MRSAVVTAPESVHDNDARIFGEEFRNCEVAAKCDDIMVSIDWAIVRDNTKRYSHRCEEEVGDQSAHSVAPK